MRKLYFAQKDEAGEVNVSVICFDDQRVVNQYELEHIECHSPDGFNLGYGGAGPADLALSILVDFLDSRTAAELAYQKFKWDHISKHQRTFSILGFQIRNWLEENFPQLQIRAEAR